MTELERARAHLLYCQNNFGRWRCLKGTWPEVNIEPFENMLLAALNWVWFEQEMVGAVNRPRWAGIRSYSYEHGRLS